MNFCCINMKTVVVLVLSLFAFPLLGQLPPLPNGQITASVTPSTGIGTGQTVTVTCRIGSYNGTAEIDSFNFEVHYDKKQFAFVNGSFNLGASSGADQQWLSKAPQNSSADGYVLKSANGAMPGLVGIAMGEIGLHSTERGTLASSGFLVSFQLRATGPGSGTIFLTPALDGSVLLDTSFRPVGTISFPSPVSISVANPIVVSVTAVDASASEPGYDSGAFLVSRTGATNAALAAAFTVTGTARPGFDYPDLGYEVVIPAGASNATLVVTPMDDAEIEGDETVTVTLTASQDYDVAGPATVVIHDDENPPPAVALTAPANGTIFPNPTNIVLTATASDSNGSVTNVEFYRDGTVKLGEDASSPYSFTWSNAPPGTYVLTAKATDNLGATADSVPLGITVRGPPSVTLTCPTNVAATASATVNATATDGDGAIVFLEIYRDGVVWAATNSGALTVLWTNMLPGTYTLTARASDDRGLLTTSAPVVVTVTAAGMSDNYADRPFLGGLTNYATASSTSFTKEPGEPAHAFRYGTRSAWVAWTAPRNGNVIVDTFGSSFDTVLVLYTNNPPPAGTVSNLTYLGANLDAGGTPQSQVIFTAVAGQSYSLAVDGTLFGESGTIHLHISQTNTPPVVTASPQSVIASVGDNVSFSVSASGASPLTNQWRWNGASIGGATGSTFTRTNVALTNAGLYDVIVSNSGGAATSAPAVLVVRAPAEFTATPSQQVVDPGGTAVFNITATGSDPLNYQWSFNGVLLPGQVTNMFTRYNAQHADGGTYSVSVANAAGSASAGAELIVRPVFTSYTSTNGNLLLNWYGTTGKVYVVEGTTNLNPPSTVWTNLGSVTNTALQGQFTVPMSNATRMIRLRVGP